MYQVLIDGVISSRHTQEIDAIAQKDRYESDGFLNITIEQYEEEI